ncbi:hypothetical protein PoB_000301300 [Plakobranchus ocellatus]|uniref:Uncharacterized protein n=1 Tax=Plakobranchus ocellatus TaxID=259542 RepID=A0AAV3Y2N2_9GAST|nr:hypothetical protein PoB_000301300 [Plakobranchus ocellatus]
MRSCRLGVPLRHSFIFGIKFENVYKIRRGVTIITLSGYATARLSSNEQIMEVNFDLPVRNMREYLTLKSTWNLSIRFMHQSSSIRNLLKDNRKETAVGVREKV